ncbi:MAG: NADH-quinone oxidoreductase subunit L, partial [Dokdonella sp.]
MLLSKTILLAIVLAPLLGALIAGLLRNQIGRAGAAAAAIISVGLSCVLSFYVFYELVWNGAPTFNQDIYA